MPRWIRIFLACLSFDLRSVNGWENFHRPLNLSDIDLKLIMTCNSRFPRLKLFSVSFVDFSLAPCDISSFSDRPLGVIRCLVSFPYYDAQSRGAPVDALIRLF